MEQPVADSLLSCAFPPRACALGEWAQPSVQTLSLSPESALSLKPAPFWLHSAFRINSLRYSPHRLPSKPVTTPFPMLAGPPQSRPFHSERPSSHCLCTPPLTHPHHMSPLTPTIWFPAVRGLFSPLLCFHEHPHHSVSHHHTVPYVRGAVCSSEADMLPRHTPCIIELDSAR